MSGKPMQTLFDFTQPEAIAQWQTVLDGVMGGVSEGEIRLSEHHTLEFFGTLSLENNGGFVSIRSKSRAVGLRNGDIPVVRVCGDGREYFFNLYLTRGPVAFSYRASLPTTRGEWIEVRFPLDCFVATRFGRRVPDANPVDPREVAAIGFMLGDKTAGPFELEIEWIRRDRT